MRYYWANLFDICTRRLALITKPIRLLTDYFAEIIDPRKARGLRHPLVAILCLCVVAMMCGAKTPKAIAQWLYNRADPVPFLTRLGFRMPYGPGSASLYRVLALVTVEAFIAAAERWLRENFAVGSAPATEVISVDGKTLRGSRKQGVASAHLLSAFSQQLQCTIAQLGVDDKTNEIGAMPEFLADL